MGRWARFMIISALLSLSLLCLPLALHAEDSPEESYIDSLEDEYLSDDNNDNVILDELNKISSDTNEISSIKENLSDISADLNESKEMTKSMYDKSNEQEQVETIDYTNNFKEIHEDLQKIMISLWCLFGMLLGSKLIRGMFGNG